MASITVLKNNVPQGPFTRAEVAVKLQAGEITLESLAFIEGLAQWTPLREVLARVDSASPPPVPSSSPKAGVAPAVYSYAATMQPPPHLVYAGFWRRVAASSIDGLVLSPLYLVDAGTGVASLATNDDNAKLGILIFLMAWAVVGLVVTWLYFTLQESGKHRATVGKRAMGLRVTDTRGERIGFGRATGRYFGKILSAVIFYVGFMMAGWTLRKQALHDMMADTLVVRQ